MTEGKLAPMKVCSKCGVEKDKGEFFKCAKSKSELQSQCKTCKVQSVVNSPSGDREHKRAYGRSAARRKYKREYHHKTKVSRNIARRMRQSLNGERKSRSWVDLVDYTIEDLRNRLESLFVEGMSWDNYGTVWEIDHIDPVASFNITSTECDDFKRCWALSNLQPLFSIQNQKKGAGRFAQHRVA